jgi:predicted amidohydrolase YtcJ
MKKLLLPSSFVFIVLFITSCNKPFADKVYFNATIWTADSTNPSASVIAIKDNRIIYVGKDMQEGKEKIDLHGQFVTPGFIDNHTHFLLGGSSLNSVHLKDALTKKAFIQTIKEYCLTHPDAEWVQGGEWNNDAWGGEMPNKSWIDSVTGKHPFAISRYDGHMILANSLAIQKAGVTDQTSTPVGGVIGKDKEGHLTGTFKDEAQNLIQAAIPHATAQQYEKYLASATQHAIENGFTEINDVGSFGGWDELALYQKAYKEKRLPLRIYSMVPLSDWEKMANYVKENGMGDNYLHWGGLKGFVDGSLGSTTAWFYEPYLDDPSTSGFNITDTNNLKTWVQKADSAGLHVTVHAIGDRANDFILSVFQNAMNVNGPYKDRRFRVEHAQHMRQETMQRYFDLAVIASMHPYHVVDDGSFAPKRLDDKRLQGTYAFRSLMDKGVRVTFGSDWTVAPLSALKGIYAATTRITSDGKNPHGWYPKEKVTVEQALKAYTVNNAFASFQDKKTGKLAKGMFADFVVMDKNLFTIQTEEIKNANVVMTVVNGKTVYQKR